MGVSASLEIIYRLPMLCRTSSYLESSCSNIDNHPDVPYAYLVCGNDWQWLVFSSLCGGDSVRLRP